MILCCLTFQTDCIYQIATTTHLIFRYGVYVNAHINTATKSLCISLFNPCEKSHCSPENTETNSNCLYLRGA